MRRFANGRYEDKVTATSRSIPAIEVTDSGRGGSVAGTDRAKRAALKPSLASRWPSKSLGASLVC